MQKLDLPLGYYELPKGRLANVVTCLEMTSKPKSKDTSLPAGYSLRRVDVNDLDSYRKIFRKVGEDLMWFSRLIMPDEKLAAILGHPQVESYALYHGDTAIGVLELDFKDMPNCELAFFGLAKEAIGGGLGRALMNIAITKAWEKPINPLLGAHLPLRPSQRVGLLSAARALSPIASWSKFTTIRGLPANCRATPAPMWR